MSILWKGIATIIEVNLKKKCFSPYRTPFLYNMCGCSAWFDISVALNMFTPVFFAILYISLAVMFVYDKWFTIADTSTVAKVTRLQIPHCTFRSFFPCMMCSF
jgi:hypothetical protein